MDPTLEESVRQYHPHKQNLLLRQSVIYAQTLFNQDRIVYDPTVAMRRYYQLKCDNAFDANCPGSFLY